MIKIKNLNKYFNKNKSNEIHVINDMTIELPSKGLVAFFGPSGCGKTTLLNVIGGLDSANSGSITFGDTTLSKYDSNRWDDFRNKEIGYVFQNYNLINEISVKENIDVALRLAGVEDGQDREQRIMHALEALSIDKYKNRRPDTLSGGQQQRVAIARAIAKHPNIIIADEPTGNLDAKNTLATMDILKQISRNCLVLLVTHEPKIVDYYADMVLQLKDGKIVAKYQNTNMQSLNLTDHQQIYLKDLSSGNIKSEKDNIEVDYYADKHAKEHPIKLTVVCQEGKYYIKADTNIKVELVENDGEVTFVNEHYVPRSKEQTERELIDLNVIKPIVRKGKLKSLITNRQSIKQALKKFFGRKTTKSRLGNFGLAISAALLIASVSMIGGIFNIDRTSYAKTIDNVVHIERLGYFVNTTVQRQAYAKEIITKEGINGIYKVYPDRMLLGAESTSNRWSISVSVTIKKFNHWSPTSGDSVAVSSNLSYAPLEKFKGNLVAGRMPENDGEIVLDKLYCDMMVVPQQGSYNILTLYGYDSYIDFLNESLIFKPVNSTSSSVRLKIVGISQSNQLCFWGSEETFYGIFRPYFNTNTATEEIKEKMISDSTNIYVLSDNMKLSIETLAGEDLRVSNLRQSAYLILLGTKLFEALISTVLAAVMVIVALVTVYFVIRSSMFTRIREIGVYRCLGAKKADIRRMFFWEAVVLSLFTSVVGFAIGAWVVVQLLTDSLISSLFFMPLWLGGAVLVVLLGLNILFGMLPVNKLLKLTPAQILSKYDI